MQPHRSSALGYASAASAAHSRVYGACAAEVAASESSGLSVGGCIRARGYFGPHPVRNQSTTLVSTEYIFPYLSVFAYYYSYTGRTRDSCWPYDSRTRQREGAPARAATMNVQTSSNSIP